MPPVLSPGTFRFRQGETIGCQAFSSVVMTFYARFRVLFDDGTQELVAVDDFTTGSGALVEYARSDWIARDDGIVLSGAAHISGGTAAQPRRGQTFVRAFISATSPDLIVGAVLFQDYLFRGYSPVLGSYVDPGPAGGRGVLRSITTTDPAAGSDHTPTQTVPTGRVWFLHSLIVTCVQGITQTPTPRLNMGKDPNAVDKIFIPAFVTQAASTTEVYRWIVGCQTSRRVAPTGGTPEQLMELPTQLYLPEGYQITGSTIGLGANTNFGVSELLVEEWIAATVAGTPT